MLIIKQTKNTCSYRNKRETLGGSNQNSYQSHIKISQPCEERILTRFDDFFSFCLNLFWIRPFPFLPTPLASVWTNISNQKSLYNGAMLPRARDDVGADGSCNSLIVHSFIHSQRPCIHYEQKVWKRKSIFINKNLR